MKYPKLWIAIWVAMILAVIIGSMMPARDVPIDMAHVMDKVVHFLGYFVLSAYGMNVFRKLRHARYAVLFLVLLGGVIEIAQGFLTHSRSADFHDFVVNGLGVLAGYLTRRTPLANLLSSIEARLFR